jgi:hypothetical protein
MAAGRGHDFTTPEAADTPAAAAWRERWDSLRLFTPACGDRREAVSAIATVCDPNMLLRLALRTGRGFKLWPRPEHRLIVARRQRGRIACMPNRFVMLFDSDTQSHLSWLGVRGSAGFGPRAPSGERCS